MINVLVDNKKVLGFGIYTDDATGAYRIIDFHENCIREECFEEFNDALKYVLYSDDPEIPYSPVTIDLYNSEEWLSEQTLLSIAALDILTQFSSNGIIMGMISPITKPDAGTSRMLTINFGNDIGVNTQLEIISKISDYREDIKSSEELAEIDE